MIPWWIWLLQFGWSGFCGWILVFPNLGCPNSGRLVIGGMMLALALGCWAGFLKSFKQPESESDQ